MTTTKPFLPPRRIEGGAIPLDPLDIAARLAEFKRLKVGWLDGKGVPPPHGGLDWLAETFAASDVSRPYLFPTPDGRVLAEWSLPPWAPSVEIDLAGKSGEWHAANLETDVEETRTLDLTNSLDWEWLAERIRLFAAGSA